MLKHAPFQEYFPSIALLIVFVVFLALSINYENVILIIFAVIFGLFFLGTIYKLQDFYSIYNIKK